MSWADDLNLLGRHISPWPGSWVLLVVAAVSVAAMVFHRAELQEAEALLGMQRVDSLVRSQPRRSSASLDQGKARETLDLSTLEAASGLLERLGHPWGAMFAGVESAANDVALLGLRHTSGSAIVEIEALVPDDRTAWRFVRMLGTGSVQFEEATLLSRETLAVSAGTGKIRIRVQAVLKMKPTSQATEGMPR